MKIKKTKASVLVVSLIVMSIVLLASMSIAFVATQERRASIGASRTGAVFQSADQVVEQTMKSIVGGDTTLISGLDLGSCDVPGDYIDVDAGTKIELFNIKVDADGKAETDINDNLLYEKMDCNATDVSLIAKIRISSISSQVGRAIEAKVDCNIRNCNQLKSIPQDSKGYYCLADYIDCSGIANFTSLKNFQGILDGRGLAIRNLTIDSGDDAVGLFATLGDGAVVRNLGIEGADITGTDADKSAGILAGKTEDTVNISNCYADTLVADSKDSSVKGKGNVGGLVGETSDKTTISQSYSNATVEAIEDGASVGGLVGLNKGKIENSYAVGNVTGKASGDVGGLVGKNDAGDAIEDSYYGGTVSIGSNLGGLIGNNNGADDCISDSYYISTNNPVITCGPALNSCSFDGAKTEDEMIKEDDFEVDWDNYNTIWQMNGDNYPCFQWQGGPDICPKP